MNNQQRAAGPRQGRYNRDKQEQGAVKPKEEFESKLLDLARVTKVTGGGKTMLFRAVVVIGDKKNKVGIGVAKGKDVSQAVEKSTRLASKHLIEIP